MDEASRVKGIISKIEQYRSEVNNMDMDVKLYLEDKTRYSYPQHEKLCDEIYKFEHEVHKVNNSEVQLRLDGLMHSLLIHKRIWERWFDEDLEARKKEFEEHGKISRLAYKASEDIWSKQGLDPVESKQILEDRIIPQYAAAKKSLKDNQKIVFVYNKNEQRIKVKVKDQ